MAKSDKKTKKQTAKKKPVFRKVSEERLKNMSFFERMRYKRRLRADKRARQHAEMLATLPKQPIKRFFAHFKPSRVFHYWFSSYGFHTFLKIICACVLIGIIAVGGLFLYYKKSLENIQLSNLVISETVNTYYDRNGIKLWEDTGNEDYRLVVDGSDISTYMRQATVAIEDKNFYNHPGVDFTALVRAIISTLTRRGVQGGSTLTQQLIKQVYFADEAASENRGGITRKIKELILSLELEKMYDKEQIITMYLNESPYGGRRNGVESAAQTYFGKSAKDLDLAESALLAGIPNNPAILNPYNEYGNEALIERQHKVLDSMASLGYITAEEAENAKNVAILDKIQTESSQYSNMLAPHFVLEVKKQLEDKYGITTMRSGGFTIKTTLDYKAQQVAEAAIAVGSEMLYTNGSNNLALVSVDVENSQILAMVGSIDFNKPGYGEVNATTSLLEPGSTIKPVLDYAPLFMEREGINFGPYSVLTDENIDSIYCAGYTGACRLRNYTGVFYGNIPIRKAMASSLNIPAVKALYINGIDNSLNILHQLGDVSYCADNSSAGLSMAIGSGCQIRMVEHANAYASLARGGAYKELSYILEVKNSSGDILETWSDAPAKQVVDPQVAYMISHSLSDPTARGIMGANGYTYGYQIPDVWTACKTGTTTTADSSVAKDAWTVSYSTAVSTVVWNGNNDGSGLTNSSNSIPARVMGEYMEHVHKDVLAAEGKWSYGNEPTRPAGIKTINGGIWPSWYDMKKNSGIENVSLEFNKYTGKLASTCTIDSYKIAIEVTKTVDPMTKKEIYDIPSGYDKDTPDDCTYVHKSSTVSASHDSNGVITIKVGNGSGTVKTYSISAKGNVLDSGEVNSTTFTSPYVLKGTEGTVTVSVVDSYGDAVSTTFEVQGVKKKSDDKE